MKAIIERETLKSDQSTSCDSNVLMFSSDTLDDISFILTNMIINIREEIAQ